jgi:hypothetical protein
MKRWLACSLAGTVAAFAFVAVSNAGCGGSTTNQAEGGADTGTPDHKPPPVDSSGGKDVHTGKDSGNDVVNNFDSNPGEAGEAGDGGLVIPAEGGPTVPSGATQLVNTVDAGFGTGGIQVVGITDDGNVIYVGSTGKTSPVLAVPLAGGTPITIVADSGTTGYLPMIVHETVFVWTAQTVDMTTGNSVGTLTFWTKAKGAQATTATSTWGAVAASQDGTKVVYTANVTSDGTSGDLVAANSDLTGKMTLLTGTTTSLPVALAATPTAFYLDLGFTNNGYFVATHEDGTTTATVSCWDSATWTKTDLVTPAATTTGTSPVLTSAVTWSSSRQGTGFGGTVVAATSAGALQAFVLPSATPVPIDTGVSSFYMKPDGSGVLYGTAAGAYKLATLPTPTLTTILATGYGGFIYNYPYFNQNQPFGVAPATISADGNWSIFYKLAGTVAGQYDLNLTQNVAAATSKSFLSAPTGSVFNDAFTADSAYALYVTGYTSVGTGSEFAYPVAGPKAVTISTNNLWDSNYLTGTKLLYNDNFVLLGAGPNGTADISTVDVAATPLAPMSIIKSADSSYWLTTDRTKMVFSLIAAGDTKTNGIWVIAP